MNKLRLAILISGTGRTLENFIRVSRDNCLHGTLELVIASKNCPGIKFAEEANLPLSILEEKHFSDRAAYNHAIFAELDAFKIDLACSAGWVRKLMVPLHFKNRVVNIHPTLLPSFGGKGMYGKHVHQAVLDHGCRLTGCTVHFVDDQYDHGPIIWQASTYITDDDTVDSLAARVFNLECEVYPLAIRTLATSNVEVIDRKVRFVPK